MYIRSYSTDSIDITQICLKSSSYYIRFLYNFLQPAHDFIICVICVTIVQLSIYYCYYSEAPLPPVKMPVRPPVDMDTWGPTIQVLSDAEMEKKT